MLQMRGLNSRTGMHAFAFFGRGHLDDPSVPEVIETENALDFIGDVLSRNVRDVARLFDNFTTTRGSSPSSSAYITCINLTFHIALDITKDSRPKLRTELSESIMMGLRACLFSLIFALSQSNYRTGMVSKKKHVKMVFPPQYDVAVVQKHRAHVIGWPESIPFTNPGKIGTVEELRELVSLWRSGACRWVAMSKADIDAHDKVVAEKLKTGELKRGRKQRSDKGTTRVVNDDDDDDDDASDADAVAAPKKKHRRGQNATQDEVSDSEDDAEGAARAKKRSKRTKAAPAAEKNTTGKRRVKKSAKSTAAKSAAPAGGGSTSSTHRSSNSEATGRKNGPGRAEMASRFKKSMPPKSREFITDDDDESAPEDDEEGEGGGGGDGDVDAHGAGGSDDNDNM